MTDIKKFLSKKEKRYIDELYLKPRQKDYLLRQFEKAIQFYLTEGKSGEYAMSHAFKDVFVADRKAILSELEN